MQPSRPRDIRQLVQQQFATIASDAPAIDQETVLIRDGEYCGHRFRHGQLTAVWFFEEHQLKIYDANGHVVRVVLLGEEAPPQRLNAA